MPPTAELTIDGVKLAKGLWRGRLPLGEHQLLVREEGYFDAERTLAVTPDSKANVDTDLPGK